MPLVDTDLQAFWDGAYNVRGPGGTRLGYTRGAMPRIYGTDPTRWRQRLNLQPGQTIAILGCGFAWAIEQWRAAGLGPMVGTDTSAWIQANASGQTTESVLNEGGLTNGSRNQIKSALGVPNNQKITWAITEDVCPILSDGECSALNNACFQLATNVCHIVSVLGVGQNHAPPLNWKFLADWKVLLAPALVMSRNGHFIL